MFQPGNHHRVSHFVTIIVSTEVRIHRYVCACPLIIVRKRLQQQQQQHAATMHEDLFRTPQAMSSLNRGWFSYLCELRVKVNQKVSQSKVTSFKVKGKPHILNYESPGIVLHESTWKHVSYRNSFWPQCQFHEIYSSWRIPHSDFLTPVSVRLVFYWGPRVTKCGKHLERRPGVVPPGPFCTQHVIVAWARSHKPSILANLWLPSVFASHWGRPGQ